LTAAPFRMTSNGFGRNLVIAEEICEKCGAPKAFVFGPGACPSRVVGAGELVADANLSENIVTSKVTTLVKDHILKYKTKMINSTKFSLMGNLVVSELPGPSEVDMTSRLDQVDFVLNPDTRYFAQIMHR
ncbi:hypothetical protein ANCDUO_19282, partial [Ancylostoma duodenale]